MVMITTLRERANLAVLTAQSRATALTEDPEFGGGRNTDEGFHVGIGAAAGGLFSVAVLAFVANKMGALG